MLILNQITIKLNVVLTKVSNLKGFCFIKLKVPSKGQIVIKFNYD